MLESTHTHSLEAPSLPTGRIWKCLLTNSPPPTGLYPLAASHFAFFSTAASSVNKSADSSSTMASYSPSTDVEDEVKCPICRDYLTDPVTLDCGHNFCQGCIQNCSDKWEEKGAGDLACPVCRAKIQKGNFRPNWDLANISEKFKLRGKELCEKHKERLHLFCRDDKELVCMFCERSPEHESHTVVLKEEVVQEYKVRSHLCTW